MDKSSTPSLLPIFRSRQQAEILTLVLGDPSRHFTMTELAHTSDVPYPSVHREIERAEAAGLVTTYRVGRTRVVQANTSSPYFSGLADVLVKAFGPPWVLAEMLADIDGVEAAYIHGSWAARRAGEQGDRPVGDIDLLVLGNPDRDQLYAAASRAEERLGRPVQITIRPPDWLTTGSGTFHATVASRPMVAITAPAAVRSGQADSAR